jgi:hypothetical protein
MEYLEYLKSLSSGDPLQQISSIPRIVSIIKEQPSTLLVNTIAIAMSTEFAHATNRVRYFIADFFSQCSVEMCMIRNKEEVLMHLMSVLDLNNPIAQCLMLKIVGHLAPLLTDMIEVHHKVLLAIEGVHRQVQDVAFSILPALIRYCPSMSKHVFDKNIPEHYLLDICKVLPDDHETLKRAYSYIVQKFPEETYIEMLVLLALRSRSLASHVKDVLLKKKEYSKLKKLSRKYPNLLSEMEKGIIKKHEEHQQGQSLGNSNCENGIVYELLTQNRLEGIS